MSIVQAIIGLYQVKLINVNKTKLVVFRKGGGFQRNYSWKDNNALIGSVEKFYLKYLFEVTLKFDGTFHKTQRRIVQGVMSFLVTKINPYLLM